MKVKTQYDKAIVEAAGIDSSRYTDAEIGDYAGKLVAHAEVHARSNELLRRSVAAQAITDMLASKEAYGVGLMTHNGGRSGRAMTKLESLHSMITKECGAAPPVLK